MVGMPAARVGDMHTCPMCMGAPMPVLPPGQINVLIGGQPAARMTDLCACVAPIPTPVDPIIMGSFTVLIGKLPAARMADPTAKGGVLLPPCCPTVLIGLVGVAAPAVPGMPGMPSAMAKSQPGPTSDALTRKVTPVVTNPICITLGVQAVEIAKARGDAMLAGAVYGGDDAPLPPNTARATMEDLVELGLHDGVHDMTKLKDKNFRSDVFVETDPVTKAKSYIVAFKGTTPSSLDDWAANLMQGMGRETAYYNQAMEIGRTASMMAPGAVRYVGHSLGGGMASAAASMSNAAARTYNAAGLNRNTLARKGAEMAIDKVKAYFVKGDILSSLQDNLPIAEAAGQRLGLPPAPRSVKGALASVVGAVAGLLGGPLGSALGALGASTLADGVTLHLMDAVMGSIDTEAERLAGQKKKNGCT